jgi:SAM-dependent methyltransferase
MSRLALSPTGTELLDDPGADPAIVARSLRNIARANWWFGGWAAVRHGLGQVLEGHATPGPPLTLLDVGTGMGDLPCHAVRWAARRGLAIRPLGLDRHTAAARLATGQSVPTAVGCGGELPFRDRGVDLVVVSQLAHHLDDASCQALFRECDRVARVGVVVADLRPSRLAALGFRLGGALLRFDPVTIDDGVTSLHRGFTASRLAALLSRAGIEAAVAPRPGARIVAWWHR